MTGFIKVMVTVKDIAGSIHFEACHLCVAILVEDAAQCDTHCMVVANKTSTNSTFSKVCPSPYVFCRWCQKKKREEKTKAEEFKAFHRVQVTEARKIKWSLDQR